MGQLSLSWLIEINSKGGFMKKLLLGLALALAGVQAVSASDDALYNEANRLYSLINGNVDKLDSEAQTALALFKIGLCR
jgi:hypothetical protein